MPNKLNRWSARVALVLSTAMVAGVLAVWTATGQAAGEPLLAMGLDVDSASVTQGTYDLIVTNRGTAPATDVEVRARVPDNTTFQSSSPAPSSGCNNGAPPEGPGVECRWNVGTLNAGAAFPISVVLNLDQEEDPYTVEYTAEARSSNADTDSDEDASLQRDKIPTCYAGPIPPCDDEHDDTYVDDAAAQNTNYGACNILKATRGQGITSFVDLGPLPDAGDIETVWGAQLRMNVSGQTGYSSASPATIGAHKITSGDWDEGSGSCAGASGSGSEARTGNEPASNSSATTTTPVGGTGPANWNVTSDLDTADERTSAAYNGWEIKDEGTTGSGTNTDFNSTEASNNQPRLFLVYTQPEEATCIDADPDTNVNFINDPWRIDALVTDGDKLEGSDQSGDGCNGSPVANHDVVWEVEDDTPDIYFSSTEGTPTTKTVVSGDATPDEVTTQTDSEGRTFVEASLDEPDTDNSGENRVGARIGGTDDPDESPECSPLVTPLCESETATEDDVRTTWSTTSPTPTGSPTGSPTASPSPSPTASPTPSPVPTVRVASTITIRHSNRPHRFKGRVRSERRRCRSGRRVVVKKVRRGPDRTVARDTTNRRGKWAKAHRKGRRGRYYAIARRKTFSTPNANVVCRRARSRTIRARR